jgi:hypothetical protein
LQGRYHLALEQSAKLNTYFDELSSTLSKGLIKEWTGLVTEWLNDRSKPSPYRPAIDGKYLFSQNLPAELRVDGMSEKELKILLTKEEAADVAAGVTVIQGSSLTHCLTMGVELEEEQ